MNRCTKKSYNSLTCVITSFALLVLQATALQVGTRANSDKKCVSLSTSKLPCPDTTDRVCAKLYGEHIRSLNACHFCTTYGNTNAVILRVGPPGDNTVSCQPLHEGSMARDDPDCLLFYGKQACTREYWPIRARLGDVVVTGGNKCDFCSKYGNSTAIILSLGTDEHLHCATMAVGCSANEVPFCLSIGQEPQTICTADFFPVCAKLASGEIVQGSNECNFCAKYGTSNAVIISIGTPCNP